MANGNDDLQQALTDLATAVGAEQATTAQLATATSALTAEITRYDIAVDALLKKLADGQDLSAAIQNVKDARAALEVVQATQAQAVTDLTAAATAAQTEEHASEQALESAPTITALDVNSGPIAGGTPVTLTGTGFDADGLQVTFGPDQANIVGVDSDTSVRVTTPAASGGAGNVPITATTSKGSGQFGAGFTYS